MEKKQEQEITKQEKKWYEKQIGIVEVKDFVVLAFAILVALSSLLSTLVVKESGEILYLFTPNFFSNVKGAGFVTAFYFIPLIAGILFIFARFNKIYRTIAFILIVISEAFIFSFAAIVNELNESSHNLGAGPIVAGVLLSLSLLVIIRENFIENQFSVREIVEIGVLVALALVFDQVGPVIRIRAGAGSINLAMLPLFIIAFRFNFIKSWIAIGVVFGLISNQMDGYGIQTYPFDYFLGYGLSVALAAFFQKLAFPKRGASAKFHHYAFFALAISVGVIGRLLSSTISGVVLYETDFIGSLVYNGSNILPTGLITLVLLLFLYPAILVINRRFPASNE